MNERFFLEEQDNPHDMEARRLKDELTEERDDYKQRFEWNFDRRHAAENEARLKGEALVQMQYRLDAMERQMEAAEAGHRMQTRATLGFRQDWLDAKAENERLRIAIRDFLSAYSAKYGRTDGGHIKRTAPLQAEVAALRGSLGLWEQPVVRTEVGR